MNEIIFYIIVLFFILIIIFLIFKNQKNNGNKDEKYNLLQDQIERLTRTLDQRMKDTTEVLNNNLQASQRNLSESINFQNSETKKLIKEITVELTEVKEANKQVYSVGEQLQNLEKVLTNQKQRGNWGEGSLELILSNFLPIGVYEMQYGYKDGSIVDAIIRLRNQILPIDSKFSIDNYRRSIETENEEDKKYFAEEFKKDIKLRIEETSKYIQETKENTLPFAFMFIPSEAIYYDIQAGINGALKINTQKLLDFAQSKKITIVSPTSIIAYLHLVVSGIKNQQIESRAEDMKKKVEDLGMHINKYEDFFKKLGNSLNTTVNHYNDGYKELKKIDKDIYKITDKIMGGEMDPVLIDRIKTEE